MVEIGGRRGGTAMALGKIVMMMRWGFRRMHCRALLVRRQHREEALQECLLMDSKLGVSSLHKCAQVAKLHPISS